MRMVHSVHEELPDAFALLIERSAQDEENTQWLKCHVIPLPVK